MLYLLHYKNLELKTVIHTEEETANKLRNGHREIYQFPKELEERLEKERPVPTVSEYLNALENYNSNCDQGIELLY